MISISDSFIHLAGLFVACILAYVGMMIRNAMLNVVATCDKVNAKIDKHEAVCEERNKNVDRRLSHLEDV